MLAPVAAVDTERTHPFVQDAKGWGTRLVVAPAFCFKEPLARYRSWRALVLPSSVVAPIATVGSRRAHPFAQDAKGWGTPLVVAPAFCLKEPLVRYRSWRALVLPFFFGSPYRYRRFTPRPPFRTRRERMGHPLVVASRWFPGGPIHYRQPLFHSSPPP